MDTRRKRKRRQETLQNQQQAAHNGQNVQTSSGTITAGQLGKQTSRQETGTGGRRIVNTTSAPPSQHTGQPPLHPGPPPYVAPTAQPPPTQPTIPPRASTQEQQAPQRQGNLPSYSLYPTGPVQWGSPWFTPLPQWTPAFNPNSWPWTYSLNSTIPQEYQQPNSARPGTGTVGPTPLFASCDAASTTTAAHTRWEQFTPLSSSSATTTTNNGPLSASSTEHLH